MSQQPVQWRSIAISVGAFVLFSAGVFAFEYEFSSGERSDQSNAAATSTQSPNEASSQNAIDGYDPEAGISDASDPNTAEGINNNPNDPYAAQTNRENLKAYLQARHEFLVHVKYMFFAADCGVLFSKDSVAGEENALMVVTTGADALGTLAQQHVPIILDTHARGLIDVAEQAGRDAAKSPDACKYWQDRPEEVASVRNEIQTAARAVSP